MGSRAAPSFLSPSSCYTFSSQSSSPRPFLLPLKPNVPCLEYSAKFFTPRTRATLDEKEKEKGPFLFQEKLPNKEVEESVKVLKNAAKTRKVPAEQVLSAFSVIEKAKVNPSGFLQTLGGSNSPGRTWMLIFTAQKQLKGGRYFPLTAVQRFDAAVSLLISSISQFYVIKTFGCLLWKNFILNIVCSSK
ncbi:hypothetical protein PTKIN_Ptkin05aG0130900 [Pterospermum kingtungense]